MLIGEDDVGINDIPLVESFNKRLNVVIFIGVPTRITVLFDFRTTRQNVQ